MHAFLWFHTALSRRLCASDFSPKPSCPPSSSGFTHTSYKSRATDKWNVFICPAQLIVVSFLHISWHLKGKGSKKDDTKSRPAIISLTHLHMIWLLLHCSLKQQDSIGEVTFLQALSPFFKCVRMISHGIIFFKLVTLAEETSRGLMPGDARQKSTSYRISQSGPAVTNSRASSNPTLSTSL